jgi:FAD-dependent urate hydroxylase
MTDQAARQRLEDLTERVRREIELTGYAARDWIPHRGDDLDVLIVGAGQAGLALSFALRRLDVTRQLVVDAAPAGRVGPWNTYARMHTLRTPKRLRWADQGVPSLTP